MLASTLARSSLDEVIAKLTTFPEAVAEGKIKVSGDRCVSPS